MYEKEEKYIAVSVGMPEERNHFRALMQMGERH
jgi:hypothetical protein